MIFIIQIINLAKQNFSLTPIFTEHFFELIQYNYRDRLFLIPIIKTASSEIVP